jgi:hypothetical protein
VPTGDPTSRRIAVLRAARLAAAFDALAPCLDGLWAEDEALVQAFRAAGCEAELVVWNARGVAWDEFDAAIVRSTWDYIDASSQAPLARTPSPGRGAPWS